MNACFCFHGNRIWFWVKDPHSSDGTGHCDFNFRRDEIYGATILLGAGGAAVLVISLSKISHLVGDYAVNALCMRNSLLAGSWLMQLL